MLLTGTPLQNSVDELFSLLNFLEPSQFPSLQLFLQQFGDLKTEEQVEELQTVNNTHTHTSLSFTLLIVYPNLATVHVHVIGKTEVIFKILTHN